MFDRAIAVVAPQTAVKRAAARRKLQILDSGYGNYGASHMKKGMIGWLHGGGSVNEDIHDHLPTLRERNRDLFAGVPIATGAIKTMRTNIVGPGLKLKCQLDYEVLGLDEEETRRLEKTIEREFSLWADTPACDLERLDNFYELQQLAFLNWLLSGDVIVTLPITKRVNMPYDLRINLIEADRLCNPSGVYNPRIIGGVEHNADGEVVAYHIAKHHPLSFSETEIKWTRVEAWGEHSGRRNVLHVMNRERIGQRRGVPFLSPVIEALKQLGRYTEAELIAAVVAGMFTVFIEKEGASADAAMGEVIPEEQQIDAGDPNSLELANGAILDLNEGEKANAVNPGRPNGGFDAFVVSICRQIGAALEIPYEVLVKCFNSSFTASRAALMEFWKSVRMYRTWLSSDFCQPIYVLWGNETACFPADNDVKNYFISVSRMFGWVANSLILTYWSKVDKKMNRRLIDSIIDSVNIWLNGLVNEEKLLGGRVEFKEEENSLTALMAGKAVFHIYLTPPSPAKELDFVLEYDVEYVSAALKA